tara:strand:- start:517 stop:1410 length:894 start_codon:yes stop_codon:yes gene_type:complete
MALIANAGTSVSNAFVTLFGDDVKHAYQQQTSNLLNSIRVVRNVTGSVYKFNTLTKGGTIKDKARFEDIVVMSDTSKSLTSPGAYTGGTAQNATVSCTLSNYHSGEYVQTLDEIKVNIDLRSSFATSMASAMARATDQAVVAALDAGTPTTIKYTAQGASGLNKAALLEAHEALNALDVPNNDRVLLISPAALTDILTDTTLISASDGQLSNIALSTGYVPNLFGFRVVTSNLLTADSVVRKCYAFQKQSMGAAIGKDININVSYVPQKASTLISSEMSLGSVMIDADGVVELQVTE